MPRARMRQLGTLALALLVLAAGCRRAAGLNPVSGKITYHGAPLPNGIVVFTPDATRGESGPIALGTIHADGTYALSTAQAPGATPGWYRVTVAAFTTTAPQNAVPLLPAHYRDPELSRLRFQVKAGQANTIDLNLD